MRNDGRASPSNLWLGKELTQKSALLTFLPLAALAYVIYYLVLCHAPFVGEPSFRIDYYATTIGRASDSLSRSLIHSRPVSELYIFIQAIFAKAFLHGNSKYIIYPVQHLSVLFYFAATAYVVAQFYSIRLKPGLLFLAWLLFMTDPAILSNVYKLETIVGTISKIFGAICLLCIVRWQKDRSRMLGAAVVLFYCLSIFSKEDLIIPPLVLLGWFLFKDGKIQINLRKHATLVAMMILSLAFFLVFNEAIIPNRAFIDPVHQANSPYYMTLLPASVLKVAAFYAFKSSRHVAILTALFAVSVAVSFAMRRWWRETLVVCVMIGGMMGPYLIMPNHVFNYYALNWTAWEAIVALLLIQSLTNRFWSITLPLSVLILAPNIYQLLGHKSDSWYIASYYRSTFDVSRNIARTLRENETELNRFKTVGVTGVGVGRVTQTPWQENGETSFFLSSDFGLTPNWVLFTKSSPGYRTEAPSRAGSSAPNVWVKNIADYQRGSIPTLAFDAAGNGVLLK